jgi:hypothetical protein
MVYCIGETVAKASERGTDASTFASERLDRNILVLDAVLVFFD